MSNRTCSVANCDTEMAGKYLRKGFCEKHWARWRKYGTPLPTETQKREARRSGASRKGRTASLNCLHCGDSFEAFYSGKKYCSDLCKGRAQHQRLKDRKNLTCATCGDLMAWSNTSAPQGEAKHNSCRAGTDESPVHGTWTTYKNRGCRCDDCMAYYVNLRDSWNDSFRNEYGVSYSTYWKRKFYADNGYWYTSGDAYIPAPVRRAVYERDGWQCQICFREIPQGGHEVKELFASLDHIESQSSALIPDHSMSNLRMAHMVCNAYRGDDRLTDEEVRGIDPAAEFLSRIFKEVV